MFGRDIWRIANDDIKASIFEDLVEIRGPIKSFFTGYFRVVNQGIAAVDVIFEFGKAIVFGGSF